MLTINIDTLLKYDKPGPRYTSYPTAPVWNAEFGPERFKAKIIETNSVKDLPPVSLYFHIPFCFSLCFYCGCNSIITKKRGHASEYLSYLRKEIEIISQYVKKERRVVQFHWGGGSPDFLSPAEMETLYGHIASNFSIAKDAEIGVELDPRETTLEHMKILKGLGFNRISMGVQDFNPLVQKAINRIQPENITRRLVNWCRDLGFYSVNIDLIYGLPHQTTGTFNKTVEKIIEINPDRIALFNYAHVPWMKRHQKVIREDTLPQGREKLEILKMAIEKFTSAGYVYVGMDHFSKPQDELYIAQKEKTLYRNFQGYTTKAGCDLFGFGITSISMVGNSYSQNHKALKDYYAALNNGNMATYRGYELNSDDIIRRHVITRLMCDFELTPSDVEKQFSITFNEYFRKELKRLEPFRDEGLLIMHPDKIEINDSGRILIRNIAMVFDVYLEIQGREMRFSRTI
ncbi:MAG: oxygen-independent coproporphyrinogen III oxidase [Nitrospirae bacterium RIFCSPLOW2_12_42_9]|nr:MAG: oxygen-independent coproporphyrinogen III oxidase [Nitrospirae bacterium GWA2_42_11]OGW60347.1 MAG: oxygen-independent coproporphyrinogen III oxidase [Nitrospirae bacterium RIFCSPLOW2_12_42_9]HAS17176.1 oxygen-independent coproporphyrinogen III oxidase [Nitrospiraceae bacterium]